MPQLNSDLLKDVFNELVKIDGFKSIDKFMMAGKEPFNIVVDRCGDATDVVVVDDVITAHLPYIANGRSRFGKTSIYPNSMLLFKPIAVPLAGGIKFLSIKKVTSAWIPMLKAIDQELKEVIIHDTERQLKTILNACINIPNVQDGVTIKLNSCYDFAYGMKSFAIPCLKLKIEDSYFHNIHKCMNLHNPHFQNIHDLTIHGRFHKIYTFHLELRRFAEFLSINFPNLKTLNVNFFVKKSCSPVNYYWNWKDDAEMANFFQVLSAGVKGSICFKINNYKKEEVNSTSGPYVQLSDDKEYYRIVPVTDTLSFKMAYRIFC